MPDNTIPVVCQSCHARIKAPAKMAGQTAKCPGCTAELVVVVPGKSQPELAGVSPNLIPCPDCDKSVSKRAVQCPHCGCPLGTREPLTRSKPSVFAAVFDAVVMAIREEGYVVRGLDKANGMVEFSTGVSMSTVGQHVEIVILPNGDGTYALNMTNSYQGITDWGEGRRIGERIVERARRHLELAGMKYALGVPEPPPRRTPEADRKRREMQVYIILALCFVVFLVLLAMSTKH